MNILYLSDALEVHDARFLSKFVRTPHRTILYSFYQSAPQIPSEIANLPGLTVVHRTFKTYPHGTEGSRRRWLRFLDYRLEEEKALDWLKKDLRRLEVDVLYAGWVLTSGFLAARTAFHPFVLMPWGSDILIFPNERKLWRWQVQYALNRADLITLDAEHVRRKAMEIGGVPEDRFIVSPWGIDLSMFHPNRQDQRVRSQLGWEKNVVLISTRQLEPIYQVNVLMETFHRLSGSCPELRLLLVGGGSCEPRLRGMVSSFGLEDRVHFTGRVPNHQLPMYLHAADIYASCSLSDGSSLCLMEAMACGLPSVISDLPANREWVEEGVHGFFFDPRNPSGLGENLERLVRDPNLRTEMGARSLEVARRKADWDVNFDRILRGVEQLSKRNSR